jgi:glycosyltransferase involved in cell wall biosynthesis
MHICLFSVLGTSEKLQNWGGVQTHAKNLVSLLINEGHEVTLITGSGDPVQRGPLTITTVGQDFGARPSKSWFEKAYIAFSKVHTNHPVDCVFSEGGSVRGLMSEMRQNDIPVVAFVHLLSFHYFYNNWQEIDGLQALKSYVFRTVPRIIYDMIKMDILFFRKCQKIITGSLTIARQLENYYGIPHNKLEVIHNWVDTNQFQHDQSSRKNIRSKFDIEDNDIAFLMTGALRRAKGFRVALRAFKEFLVKFPNASLLLSGEGPDRRYLEKNVSCDNTLKDKIKLTGSWNHSELSGLLSAGDIFIMPSLMNEVLPYTLLEAMACELPIIATKIAANKEALGSSGFFFSRGDARSLKETMLSLSSDLRLRTATGALNRKRIVERFSDAATLKKLRVLLAEVLAESS